MNEPNDEEREKLLKIIKDHTSKLCEHFDNVQIFCNSVESGGDSTVSFQNGSGNWHSRLNHAREWVMYHDQKNKCKAIIDFEDGD